MKKRPTLLSALLLCFIAPHLHALEPASERIVVMLSVDGLAHFYFDDPKAEMPNLRRLAAEGARAEKMLAVLPTVTWPNHTSLVTGVRPGKHGVVGNTYFDRDKNEVIPLIWDPLLDKEQIVKVPTIYDVAKQAGLRTAAVTWPGSRGAKTLDWTVPCVIKSDLFVQHSTPSLLEEFKQAGIPYENEADGFKEGRGEDRDRWHLQQFAHIVRTHRPNLALYHILEVDHVEHAHGPQSPEAYAAVKFADGLVGELWQILQDAFPGKATLVVVSDHGFFDYRQMIRPNVALQQAGLLTALGGKITGGKARALSQGGSSMIYITDHENREALIPQIAAIFKDTEGVSQVITPSDFPAYGLTDSPQMPQAPDLILCAREGYMFQDLATGDELVSTPAEQVKGTHGYDPNEERLHASFIASGAGIKPGSQLGTITNTSVAPTLAALLGLKMENVEGRVLEEILGGGEK
ncbi:MAG TPA: ectonucleotide pyrophosphatase/phosphodiesterase [Bacteroidia bacterium]|nr:ectonucleotide pyrophosphatase/phosphodiesterase [Bacteroidia bacterium]